MNILHELKNSLVIALVLLVICCGVYPLFVYGAGQLLFPAKANGSLVFDNDHKPIASTLLAQAFTAQNYFSPRPSSAGTGYDSTSSSGSNLGPTSQSLHDTVQQRVSDYRKANGLADSQLVPADAVEASGSGLDPHISLKNALLQLPRVAKARGLTEADLKAMVVRFTDGRDLGILGEPGVNVVKLNLALDGKYK
jgi:K+-transporting ATPase ATPase C chain